MTAAKRGLEETCRRVKGRPKPRNPGGISREKLNELLNRDYLGQQWSDTTKRTHPKHT
jgi:hypothetical protein